MSTFVYMTRCDGCGHCVDICPSDIMHIDETIRRAKNIEPNFCWECYSCVKACPNHAIDVRGYADFAPMGHSVRVRREEEKGTISWKIKFRNGTVKDFVSPITTKPWGKHIPKLAEGEKPNQGEINSQTLYSEPEGLNTNKELPKVPPISEFLFKIAKPKLKLIDNIYALEGPLYSKQLGIAGTVDCIAEYDGELSIIDFKTSQKPKPREWIEHYFVQAMAYGCMLYEMRDISVKKLVIIMACENGECVVYEETDKAKYIKLLGEYIRKFVGDKLELYGTN